MAGVVNHIADAGLARSPSLLIVTTRATKVK